MSQYKVGDVAALFSKPKEPTTESGKKLQSLFKEFHSKNKKFSSQTTEKEDNNLNQGNEKFQNQRVTKNGKKRKFSAVTSSESDEVVNISKNLKKVKKDDANSTKHKEKCFLVEQDFPRKKSFKTNKNNLNHNSFNSFEVDETSLSDDIKQVPDVNFKSKNKTNDKKQVSNFIRKSKKQRHAGASETIKSKDNEIMSDVKKVDANSTKRKEKCFLVEQDFPRKKSFKTNKNNLNHNSFNSFEADKTSLSDDIKQVPDVNFKSKNKTNDKKQVSNFIRKSKKQRHAGARETIKSKDNEIMSDEDASINDTLFKEDNEEFVKQNAKKQMKKKFHNDSFVQNKQSNHSVRNDSVENETLFKKSHGNKNKQNSRPNISQKGEPDFIKIPDSKPEDEELSRTLFVGNLPVNINRKALRTLFSPFGDIQDIRYHGIETDKAKIFSEYGSQTINANNYAADSVPGFIVFCDRQSAVKALSLSGSLFKGRHITVDFALPAGTKKFYDDKRSIFIGNLPFDCQDENVWEAFSECGRIENVRIVRDKKTGIGKGFGYVQFSTVQCKANALALEDLMIQGRSIRIKPVDSNQSKQKKAKNPPPVKRDTLS